MHFLFNAKHGVQLFHATKPGDTQKTDRLSTLGVLKLRNCLRGIHTSKQSLWNMDQIVTGI